MRHTQSLPTCPNCGATVHRTHTCRVSGLTRHELPERPDPNAPHAEPHVLVSAPEGWRPPRRPRRDRGALVVDLAVTVALALAVVAWVLVDQLAP